MSSARTSRTSGRASGAVIAATSLGERRVGRGVVRARVTQVAAVGLGQEVHRDSEIAAIAIT